ncbi:hypothetical protein HYW53_03470 [Candidatus Giovannonibacteria bacterium]|nr:hypothetical protein [Candidatus Giovannonibacteria bacterium]
MSKRTDLIIVLIAIIIGVSYYIWIKQAEAPAPVENQNQQTEQENDETAGWKTYRNTEYGFEVKYPDGWKLVDTSRNVWTSDKGNIKSIGVNIESPKRYDLPGYIGVPVNYRILIYIDGNFNAIADFGSPDPKYGKQSAWNIDVPKSVKESTEEFTIGQKIINSYQLIY